MIAHRITKFLFNSGFVAPMFIGDLPGFRSIVGRVQRLISCIRGVGCALGLLGRFQERTTDNDFSLTFRLNSFGSGNGSAQYKRRHDIEDSHEQNGEPEAYSAPIEGIFARTVLQQFPLAVSSSGRSLSCNAQQHSNGSPEGWRTRRGAGHLWGGLVVSFRKISSSVACSKAARSSSIG